MFIRQLFLLAVAIVTLVASQRNCNREVAAYHRCVTSSVKQRASSINMGQLDGCFQRYRCSKPSANEALKALDMLGAPAESERCSNEVKQRTDTEVQRCVRRTYRWFDIKSYEESKKDRNQKTDNLKMINLGSCAASYDRLVAKVCECQKQVMTAKRGELLDEAVKCVTGQPIEPVMKQAAIKQVQDRPCDIAGTSDLIIRNVCLKS